MKNTTITKGGRTLRFLIYAFFLAWPWLRSDWFVMPSAITHQALFIAAGVIIAFFSLLPRLRLEFPNNSHFRYGVIFLAGYVAVCFISWFFADDSLSANFGLIRVLMFSVVAAGVLAVCAYLRDYRPPLRAIGMSSAVVGASMGLVFFCKYLGQDAFPQIQPFALHRWNYPFGMPASFGAFMLAGCLSSFGLALEEIFEKKRALPGVEYLIMALSAATGLVLSGTFSCFAGAVAGMWALWLAKTRDKASYLKVSVLLLSIVIIFPYNYLTSPLGRQQMFNSSWGMRPLLAKVALLMAADRPLLGWGPGNFAHGACLKEDRDTFLHSGRGGYLCVAHCEPAQILAETGIAGFVMFMSLLFLLCKPLFLFVNKPLVPEATAVAGRIPAVTVLALTVDSCFSPSYQQADIYSLYAVCIAVAVYVLGLRQYEIGFGETGGIAGGVIHGELNKTKDVSGLVRFAGVIFGIGALVYPAEWLYSQYRLREAFIAHGQGDYAAVLEPALSASTNAGMLETWQQALGLEANAQLKLGSWKEGVAANQRVLDSFPGFNAFARANMLTYGQQGLLDEEFKQIVSLLSVQPYSVEFRRHLHAFIERLDHDQFAGLKKRLSGGSFDKLTQGDWYFLDALSYRANKETGKSYQILGNLRATQVTIVPFFTEYGAILVEDGEYAEALDELEMEISEIPADPVALYYAARAHKENERYEEAMLLLERAVTSHVDYAPAVVMYADFLLAMNDPAGAEEVLRRSLVSNFDRIARTVKDKSDLYAGLVKSLRVQGKDAEAAKVYAEAVESLKIPEMIAPVTLMLKKQF